MLRQAATQTLPILRSASTEDADQSTRYAGRRRLEGVTIMKDSGPPYGLPRQKGGQRWIALCRYGLGLYRAVPLDPPG